MLTTVKRIFANKHVQWALKTILAIVALAYLVYVIEPSEIASALANARWGWVLAAAALLPVNLLLEGMVWRKVLRPVAPDISFRRVMEGLLCGFSLGVFTPARVGEFAGRAFYISHADRWETTVTVFMQRLIDMAVSVAFGSAMLTALLATTDWFNYIGWSILAIIGWSITLALLSILLFPRKSHALLSRLISSTSILKRLRLFKRISRRSIFGAIFLAGVRYGVYITQFVFLAAAFTDSLTFPAAYTAVMLVYLAKFLAPSITLMDLGLREGFAVFFFGVVGLSQAAAFNSSLFVFLLNIAIPAAIGIPYLLRMRISTDAPDQRERETADIS